MIVSEAELAAAALEVERCWRVAGSGCEGVIVSAFFGIATVTPALGGPIDGCAAALGLGPLCTGIRLTAGDPRELTPDAQAVIIGGGSLGQAAIGLFRRFDVPAIAPISAAVRQVQTLILAA